MITNLNIEKNSNKLVFNKLMITDYEDREIGVTGFDIGEIVVIHSKTDENDNYLGIITGTQAYYDDPDAYENFLNSDELIEEFLNCPKSDGSAEWIVENNQYLMCWEIFAHITNAVSFENAKSWC